jgi:hypothetical protein
MWMAAVFAAHSPNDQALTEVRAEPEPAQLRPHRPTRVTINARRIRGSVVICTAM